LGLELPPDYRVGGFTPAGLRAENITLFYTRPEYVAFDPELPDFIYLNSTGFNIYDYMGVNYTPYSSADGLKIYKLSR